MQVYVAAAEGKFSLTLEEGADINDLKLAIEDREFIPASAQRLQVGTRCLEAGEVFGQVEEDDIIEVLLDVDGGMRAKWRKKRMRRLRRKRRKMRQRAR